MESSPLAKLAAVMPEVDPNSFNQGSTMKTSTYYKSNLQHASAKTAECLQQNQKGLMIRTAANKRNRKLGTYGNGDGKDASYRTQR